MRYPKAGDLQAKTQIRLTTNPENASGSWEVVSGTGGVDVFARREDAEFLADELARQGIKAVVRRRSLPGPPRFFARAGRPPGVPNPAAAFTAKGERMYQDIKAGYERSKDPRAKEIAARTVWARAKAGVPGLIKKGYKYNPAGLDRELAARSLHEEEQAIATYGKRLSKAKSPKLRHALQHAQDEEREHAASFAPLAHNPEETFDVEVLEGMTNAIWVMAWASWLKEQPRKLQKELGPGPGGSWEKVAPDSPPSALVAAEAVYTAIERINGKSMTELLDIAAAADGAKIDEPYADAFGHYLAMQAMDEGVSWFDDHAEFPLELPRFEVFSVDGQTVEWSGR